MAVFCVYRYLHVHHEASGSTAFQKSVVVPFIHNLSACVSGTRTHIDNVVGNAYHFFVVFDQDDRIAVIAQPLHRFLHQRNVVVVQSHTRLVEYVEHIGERRVDVFCNLASLGLAARQCADRPVEGEISETDFLQCIEALAYCSLHIHSQGVGQRVYPPVQPCNRHVARLGYVHPLYATRQHFGVEACAATVGACAHGEHGVEHRAM